MTKTSGLIAVGPLLVLWGLAQLRLARTASADAARRTAGTASRRSVGLARTVGGSVLILLVAAVVVGPFLARVTAEFGHPLGPPRLRESIPMERHDPPSILVNALRIGHTAFDTPLAPLRRAGAEAIIDGAEAIGVDPQDRAITFGREMFPEPAWYPDEDRVAFPLAGALAVIGAVIALARPRRIEPERAGPLRAYAVVVLAAVAAAHRDDQVAAVGQPAAALRRWCSPCPLAGLWLDALSGAAARVRTAVGGHRAAVTVLATSALAGVLALSYGFPRRLVGAGSVFTTSDWDTRFLRRPQWADEFRWAADAVRDSGARRIGLVQQNDNWEYPWWLLLRQPDGRLAGPGGVAVGAAGTTAGRPVLGRRDRLHRQPAACAKLVPAGWRLEFRGYVGYALPPGR